jgi:Kiwa protein KwaB-like
MNFYVLAGTRTNPSVLVLTLDNQSQAALTDMMMGLVETVKAADHVEFEAGYKADEGEVVTLSPFELPDALSALTNATDATVLPPLNPANIDEVGVRAIAAVEWEGNDPDLIAFQRIESRYVLREESWRLMFAQGRFVRDDRPGLEIVERVDAILEDDTLHVVSWARAHSVLDLTAWMREATVTEMQAFFKHKKLALADGFTPEALADTAVRRKVASITDRNLLDKCSVQSLRQYAAKFELDIKVSKGRIVLPATKKEFKAVLGLLDEDLLSFEPTDERWIVNSKRRP